ncbi:hypothetical protein [Ensifer soli]|uniref:hypothetical protein n=1 Tax=Ciceribacter sp. sgz301302 TaxID=3342379 RepID=UPI0035B9B2B5
MSEWQCKECGLVLQPGIILTYEGEPVCKADDETCSLCQDARQKALEDDARRYRFLRDRLARPVDVLVGGVYAGRPGHGKIITGEDLDRAVDAELGMNIPHEETLEQRLAQCLAAIVDTPLMTGRDEPGGYHSPLELRLGFFRPDLSERAAELLEEAGL